MSNEIVDTLGYFDAANFARRIECAAILRTGGWDGVCPPTSVFVAFNNIAGSNKEISFAPQGGHTRGNFLPDDEQDVWTYSAEGGVVIERAKGSTEE